MSDCTCDKEQLELIKKQLQEGVITVKGMGYYRDGALLYSGDAWGFRTKVPGECQPCYDAWLQRYNDSWDDS